MTLIVACAFPLGAFFSYYIRLPSRVKGDIPAYSAGLFFSTIAFILIDESIHVGSFITMSIGFIAGSIVFSLTHRALKTNVIKDLIQNNIQTDDNDSSYRQIDKINRTQNKRKKISFSTIIIVGKLMDSLPKALFIGIIIALDLKGLFPAIVALFLGNLTATMEGARRMKEEGKSITESMQKWMYIFSTVTIAGPIGYFLAKPLPYEYLSIMIGFAAGSLIAFIAEDLIPEAYKKGKWHIGLSTAFGFLTGMMLFHYL
ncbi:MAG: ZIP family metal transporter [Nitrososphaeraceae archaeon]